MDYCVPQLYWEIGHKAADYDELIHWWNSYCRKTDLYIGEDVERTVKHADPQDKQQHQLKAKMTLHEQLPNVKGTVLWYAKAAVDNIGNYGTLLRNHYWRYPALPPVMRHIDHKGPKKVGKLKLLDVDGQRVLFWSSPKGRGWKDEAVRYAVYRFDAKEPLDIDDASKILTFTTQTHYEIPADLQGRCTFVVTAFDRMHNESGVAKVKMKK